MKKCVIYLSVIVLILSSLITALILNTKNSVIESVVYIESISQDSIKAGYGFVYKIDNNKNYIITNYHVISDNSNIYVYNEKDEKIKANIFKYDEYTDIAILVIEDKLNLKEISIGNSSLVNNNDSVYIMCNKEKIKGNILSKNKDININNTNFNTIEVNINVDYGNSGGALLNKNNEVIGMIFVMDDRVNIDIGYALPINFVIDIVEQLEKNEIKRPNLGAVMCNSTNAEMLNEYSVNIEKNNGVVLLELKETGSLYKAGLQKGDIIIKFNNKDINNINDLKNELYKKKNGEIISIEYVRGSQIYHKEIKL